MGQKPKEPHDGWSADDPLPERPAACEGRAKPSFDAIQAAMAGITFENQEELQAVLNRFMERHNNAPQDDFAGLSPNQMHQIVSLPFEAPEVLKLEDMLPGPPDAPIIRLFDMLIGAIGEKGIKPTATGNLPRDLVRSLAKQYWTEEEHAEMTQLGDLRTEPEFQDLNTLRETAQMAGLIRRYKGRYILSRTCRSIHNELGLAGLYVPLLQTYCTDINWAYFDRSENLDVLQTTWAFSAYLLHRFGDTWRENAFYEDAYLRAFPMVLNQIPDTPYSTPERTFRRIYSHRVLKRLAGFFGWVETERTTSDVFDTRFRVRKRPLLDQALVFHV